MKNKNTIGAWLLNPFLFIAGIKALIIGLAAMILVSILGYLSNTHFDGVLDLHYGCADIVTPYSVHALYQLINWFSITIIFYVTARVVTKSNIRFVDIAGTLALSQTPLIFAALTGFLPNIHLCFGDLDTLNIGALLLLLKENIGILLVGLLFCILFTIWSVILKYKAYSVSANIKGMVGGVSFAIALIISEIISKLLCYFIIPVL